MTHEEIRMAIESNDLIQRSFPIFTQYLADGLGSAQAIQKTGEAIDAWKEYRDAHQIQIDPAEFRAYMIESGELCPPMDFGKLAESLTGAGKSLFPPPSPWPDNPIAAEFAGDPAK